MGFAVLYCVSLPSTVQTLDTGEVVAAAWKLTLAHPPGYPLFVWLQHAFMKLCPWGSVFHRAALGNALCALATMALLLRIARSWIAVALVAAVGTTSLVWRYAVLPDVFGLHLLLTMALVTFAFAGPSRLRVWGAAMAFGLGAANHQSIIFLLPLLLVVALEEPSRARAGIALAAGCAITVGLYASLLALDSASLSAWATLRGPADVVDHFLRRSYGTFQLSGYQTEADVSWVLGAFARACGPFGVAAVVVIVAGGAQYAGTWKERGQRTWWLALACLIAYIAAFFPRMNSGAHALHDGVRERFFLFPMILLAALAVRVVVVSRRVPRAMTALAGTMTLLTVVQVATSDAYGLREDTVVEDYVRNLLDTAKSTGKPALVLVETDTQLFASYYLKAVESGYDDVTFFGMGNIFLVDRLEKMKARWPAFVYDVKEIFEGDRRGVFRSFIAPNLEAFAVLSVVPVTNPSWRTTFYPLGRRIEPGMGVAIADAPVVIRPPVFRADNKEYVETKELFADYAVQHLARGKALLAQGDAEGAKGAFLGGLMRVPYCIPCLKNFCTLDGQHDERCGQALQDLQESEYHYLE
ncbi:MAG: DUF2723 domain-containing protein [Myxococcota bacterium]